MVDNFALPEDDSPELAQEPAQTPTAPPDYKAKRAKFLGKFAELSPEAKIDEPTLAEILADEQKGAEFTSYVNKLNSKFTMSAEELATELGYSVKKKPGGGGGSTGGEALPGVNPAQMQAQLGINPQDIATPQATPQPTPAPQPQEAPSTTGTSPLRIPRQGQLYTPGDEYIDAGLPLPSGEELRAQEEARQREKDSLENDGFFASFGKSLYNNLDPKRIGGNLLDFGGDLIELIANNTAYDDDGTPLTPINELGRPLSNDKFSDRKGAELVQQAQASDLPLSQAAQAGFLTSPSPASAGNLLGSGVASILPVATATALAGPGAGFAVGGGLGISSTKDTARQAGISDDEATVTALILAPIQGALEAVGVKDPGVAKLAVRATLREAIAATGGKLSQAALTSAAKKVLPELTRRAAAGAGTEALTEFLQGEAEGAGKLLADKLRGNESAAPGQGRYGVTPLDALVKSPLEQALVGGALGGSLGTLHGTTTAADATPTPAATRPQQRADLPQQLVNKMPVPSGLQALANAQVLTTPGRRKIVPTSPPARSTATDPGPTADNRPRRPTIPQPDELTPQPTGGPTLGELVPDSTPVSLDFSGEPVQAFRNAEGDIELRHAAGNVSVIDKGETFDKPAVASLLTKPKTRVKAGDTFTLGSGEFASELPIENLLRDQSGRIEAVMVEGKTGSRIIEGDTPEGKAALAELNAREQQPNEQPATAATPSERKTEPTEPATPSFGTPAENRAAGKFTKDGAEYTRQEPLTDRSLPGKETSVHFASGVAQRAKFALVEAADLQPSHTGGRQNLNHFLPEAQPKNRSTAFDKASERAIADIAERPDVNQLGEAPNAYTGAPVINSRGEVIQGNGRAEGIRQHYRKGGKEYRAGVFAEAKRAGIDPTKAVKMKEPVLVRVADVSDQRARELGNYTAADTESGGTRRLDVKQAAGRLDADTRAELGRMLAPKGDATLAETIRAKQEEITRFMQKNGLATPTQLQTLFKADGTLTPRGMEDVTALHRQLLFAEGDPNLPELFQELPAAAQGGLDRAVGYLAGLPAADSIVPELQNAITGVREYQASGLDLKTWARQQSLFGEPGKQTPAERYSPLEIKLVELLADEKRPTYIAKVFSDYAAAVQGEGPSLFGSKPALSRADAIAQTFRVTDATPQPATSAAPTNGRPEAPAPRGMEGPADNAQRASKPAAATPKPAGGAAEQQLDPSTPAGKRQQALDKIKARRTQQPPTEVNEYSKAYPLRENEPESIRKEGHAALADAEKARRKAGGRLLRGNGSTDRADGAVWHAPNSTHPRKGKAEVSQSSISAELRHKGTVSFIGRSLRTAGDLAEMLQIVRDPRMETFRYFFVKDMPDGSQKIVDECVITARMPGATPAFPHAEILAEQGHTQISWLQSRIDAVGADGYWAQHNHPSGDTTPSQPDKHMTQYVAKNVPGFRGHVIINHQQYSLLESENGGRVFESGGYLAGRIDYTKHRLVPDPLLTPGKPGPLLGREITSPHQFAAVAKEIEQRKGWGVFIGMGGDGTVTAIGHVPLETLGIIDADGNRSALSFGRSYAAIRSFARETGALKVMLGGLPKPKGRGGLRKYGEGGPHEALIGKLIAEGWLSDAVDVTGRLFSDTYTPQKNSAIGDDRIPTPRGTVREDGAAYGLSPEDAADFRTILDSYAEEGTTGRKAMAARFREDVGDYAETGLNDEALRGMIRDAQQAAGIVPKNKPEKASKARRHATRYDEATRTAFTQDEARYTPKTLIENEETAAKYIRQVGIENAYAVALDKPEGFSGAAHIEVQEAVAKEYRRLSDEARKAGNTEAAAEFWQKSKDVRAAKVSALTDAGQTLSQVQAFAADNPEAVLDLAIKETEKQRKPKLAKAEKDGAKVAGKVVRVRRNAMDAALKSDAVRKAREQVAGAEPAPAPEPRGYGMANKYFTKATALSAREALRKLGLSTIIPPELVHFVGYHVEALARTGGNHSFAEVSKRVVRELGAKVKPLLPEAYERARGVYVKKGGENKGFSTPEEIAAHIAPAAVKTGMKQLGTTLDRIAREHAEGVNMKGRTLAERFAADAGISPAQAKFYADAVEAEFNKQVSSRKSQLRAKVLTFSTRVLLGRNAATAVDKLLSTLNLASDPASAGELLKKQLNLPDITPEQADKFVKLSEAVRKARPGNDRSDRVQDLMSELGKLKHVSWGEAAESMFMANILSGPLTHAKNIVGNLHQAGAEGLISTLHTWGATGSLRAAAGPAIGAYRAQRRAFAEAAKILSTGYFGTQSEKFGNRNYLEDTTFKGAAAPLNALKYVGRALVGADGYFNMGLRGLRSHELALKNAYAEVKRQASLDGEKLSSAQVYERAWSDALGTLYGLPDLRAAAESQADAENLTGSQRSRRVGELVNEAIDKQQAKWASTADSEGLTGVHKAQRIGELQEQAQPEGLVTDAKRFAEENTFNSSFEGRLGAMGSLLGQLSDIPVGKVRPFKVVMPFVRILTAVQNRRLDWTPWGMVRAAKGTIGPEQYMGGKFYREYTNEERQKLALKSTLGTLSAVALYGMAKAGLITITGSMYGDRDKEQQSPSASIKWGNGLFTSYKDTPNEILLAAIGNTLAYDRKQEKAGKEPDTAKRLAVIAGLTSAYTLSMGPLRGLDDFNKNVLGMMQAPDRGVNYVAKLATNTAKGLIPYSALDQQLLQGLNILAGSNQKETTSDSAWETAYNQLIADVPVARNAMGDMVDILGAPIKASSTRLWGFMPERSEADQRGLDFLAAHDLLPARSRVTDEGLAGYDVKTGKVRPMKADEFYTFQVARGKFFARQLRAAMVRPSQNPDFTPEQRAIFLENPQADKALPDLPLAAARKRVTQMHKAAVAEAKRAVFTPTPSN